MSNENKNRVLIRMGARQLTQNETVRVAGGAIIPSLLSRIITGSASDPDFRLDE